LDHPSLFVKIAPALFHKRCYAPFLARGFVIWNVQADQASGVRGIRLAFGAVDLTGKRLAVLIQAAGQFLNDPTSGPSF
jgi:hypothetical protein